STVLGAATEAGLRRFRSTGKGGGVPRCLADSLVAEREWFSGAGGGIGGGGFGWSRLVGTPTGRRSGRVSDPCRLAGSGVGSRAFALHLVGVVLPPHRGSALCGNPVSHSSPLGAPATERRI